jgi:N-acetylmuramoyl-L-alanine amidase
MLTLQQAKITFRLGILAICFLVSLGCSSSGVSVHPAPRPLAEPGATRNLVDPYATQVPIFDGQRLLLTSVYSRVHYGKETSRLTDPELIVVHYTAIASLQDSLHFFQPALLDRQFRQDIASGGDVNVSAHYLVDTLGERYQLAPEDVICRHTIGFNYTAIGIENVAADADHLSDRQAQATAGLISRIVSRHPTIHYLIGHHEYQDKTLPHYRLLIEHDAAYAFTDKIDPGPIFMARVRQLLKELYGMTLFD